ncbi:amidase [Actinomyces minihominis]|uniref:amidase n=1 Tax=Actinomyces minihominis TaxID=2002838 RepID=UPI000C084867|nr:amidase [Actinomyces minihominis]
MAELHELTALEQRTLLEKGEIGPVELTSHYLERIERINPTLHALTTVTPDLALERAASLEKAVGSKHSSSRIESPLWGMPFADKDLNDRAGVRSTYGSRLTADFVPEASSQIVTDMDAAGGVSLGKSSVPEFGFPAYSENLLPEGFALNPWDLSRDPGGSSSGAAAAVAAGILPFAPGNDAGGSVRIPAAACGLVGLKPSRGRVPGESGLGALAGLPTGGPIARTAADAALLLDGMVRGQNRYAVRAPNPRGLPATGSYLDALQGDSGRLRIGWNMWSPWATDYEIAVDAEVEEVFRGVLRIVSEMGHSVEEAVPTAWPSYVDSFRAVWMSSAASLPFPDEALGLLEPLTSWLVQMGRARPAADLPRALANLSAFEAQIIEDYQPFDIILTPALAMTARPLGWFDKEDGDLNFIQQCQFTPFTSYVNVTGLPAISLPAGMSRPQNGVSLPIGVQGIGRPGDEVTLLRLAADLEQVLSPNVTSPGLAPLYR